MTPEFLSRIQFALTASFHFIFPPISMGLGLLLVIIGIIYVRTGNPVWRRVSFFGVQIYGLVFALGIATGIVQEFEFGTNWADYSRFVGNIFGSLLAAEGIFAFFLEGGFLGLMLFGGNRLGPRMWLFAIFMVSFGAHFSALWILMANSWMQTPAGYTIMEGTNGPQAFMTTFSEVVFTPSFLPRLFHVWVASWMVGASLMLSISAWYLLKNRHLELAKHIFQVALPLFAVLAILQLFVVGAQQAIEVTNEQPLKLAAMEGLWETQSCAPFMLFGWVDVENQTTYGVGIPCLLSVLTYFNPRAEVAGLDSFASDPWPPINLVFQVYHIMINLGFLFVLIGLVGAFYFYRGRRIYQTRWLLWVFVFLIVLTEVATISGWWTTEVGRQPWIVYNIMKTADGVSSTLTSGQLVFSVGMFIVLYIILFILFLFLLNEKIQHGPAALEEMEEVPVSSLPDSFREIFSRQHRA